MIRAIRATDALAISLPRAAREARDLTARTWPRTPPENWRPALPQLLLRAIAPAPNENPIGVDYRDGRVTGLVLTDSRAGGLIWDVEHLRANNVESAVELLRWTCDRGRSTRQVRRVFVDTPVQGIGADAARRAGFQQYTEGGSYRLDPGFTRDEIEPFPARPRLRSDEHELFQLYNTVVPANVRSAEALTLEEWGALYPGRKLWAPRVLGDRQDYVWELGSHIAGWMRVIYGQRAQHLELLIHPMYESYADRMVNNAITQMGTKAPVLIDVREYQGAVRDALERGNFHRVDDFLAWVVQLAERVPELRLKVAPVPPPA
jgi:hypothetical protein